MAKNTVEWGNMSSAIENSMQFNGKKQTKTIEIQ